jgi:hypothetical protein
MLVAPQLQDSHAQARLVLVVDQAEELWTLIPADGEARATAITQQQRFLNLLLTAATAPNHPLLIVLTLRADFLHRAIDQPNLARAISDHNVMISPLTREELRDAIVRPAEAVGGSFEPGLVDELIAQTYSQPGALPLLEYTLQQLSAHDQTAGTMTWSTYRALGGVEGGIAATADQIVAQHYTSEQQAELRSLLLKLVQPGEGTVDTRRRAHLTESSTRRKFAQYYPGAPQTTGRCTSACNRSRPSEPRRNSGSRP